ncbi:recombination endonuclease VII [Aeromonas phage Atoyac23]|uniref:Recombination endonuclease VII n=1 Tax=Aeromonas phage Atoyac1 TaxID=2767547 RepID=A0A866D180_9CAUD|nr:recombination endonuclease VII [Aeromonas phage Atoyac1]QOC54358.1 recombination endonuclease VII [Aeromonas phage Atoyac14]QOC54454.1 recombination endonuclease VII [Aeromonas phage Atoyac23]
MKRKLTRAQMTAYKLKWMRAPGAKCPLCTKPFAGMESKNVVVDHDHDSGLIRGLLCRGCNGAEGKVANAAGRWAGLGMNYERIVPWLEQLVAYLKSTPTDFIYPTHLTEEEKKKAAGDKRRLEAQKKAKARAAAIKEKRAAR